MESQLLTHVSKTLTPFLIVLLIGCSSDDPPITDTDEVMQSETSAGMGDPDGTDGTGEASAGSTVGTLAGNTAETLAPEATITADLVEKGTRIYKIDSGANISVVSNNGDVDLFLLDEIADIEYDNFYENEKNLCVSSWGFKEDVCSATAEDGDLYAVILAFEDTNYSISATAECSVETVNRWVYRNMLDYYFYASEVPDINPDVYTDSSELVKDLRFESLDPFSNIQDAVEQTRLYEEGISAGFGFGWQYDANDDLRILYTFDDGAFGRAGIKRGDIAVSINGELLDDMSDDRYFELIGTPEIPVTANWEFIDGETGNAKTVSIAQGEHRLNTVLQHGMYTDPNFAGVVGHIVFKQFLETSVAELDSVIQGFVNNGVTELVLDLRYNGGGRSSVGARLSSQIAGPVVDGQLRTRDEHNAKYSAFDYERFFQEALPALDLSRVIVLTTDSTASASERLISSLRPYFEVVTIGSATRGKAFSSNGRRYCGKILNAMQTQGVNANGVSVAGGISADCYAADDTSNNFGLGEGMFVSALDYISNGNCQVAPTTIAARSARKIAPKLREVILLDSLSE